MKVNAISYLTRPSIMGFELKMAFSAHFVLRNVHVLYILKKGLIISALFFYSPPDELICPRHEQQ